MGVPIVGNIIFHEAGHGVMFTYYKIPIETIRVRPDISQGYGGMVLPAKEEPNSGKDEIEKWMQCAAAGEAAERRGYGRRPREGVALIELFEQTVKYLTENLDPPFHHDLINFVRLAQARDRQISSDLAGPANWKTIWQAADELIRGPLWPAVEALFGKLLSIAESNIGKPVEAMPDLDGTEAAEIVQSALPPSS